ncbi:acyltransferase family protein [Caballeronia sordidicola]|uniref:Acyltransferase family protein n=1 Tax=Caballeronia sordidicola TaxID=196367 RepID=A0A226WKS2_CABSO|nr:acyltransferase [Caballeronia sordidicola]OXC71785.1 acyltransferase family protein [Caballeronia sordidicola]
MERNNELEALRAVGIIYVLITHLGVFMPWDPKWQQVLFSHLQFWGGVDLFFTVSGFVIMRSLLPVIGVTKTERYWQQIGAFWVRRFYRLVPASWLWLFISIMLAIFYNEHGSFSSPALNLMDTVSQFFYMANWHSYFCATQVSYCGINAAYWSLSLEEQFYFILPIAIFFLRKRLFWLCCALIMIQFPLYRPIFSALWLTRIDAVLWGVLIAIFSQSPLYTRWKPVALRSTPFRLLVTGMLLLSLAVLARQESIPFFVGMLALCSAVMVWLASYDEGLMFRWVRHSRVIQWIGSRSYSIYLAHPIMFLVAVEYCKDRSGGAVGANDTFRILVGGLLLSGIGAELCYRFIETPFRLKGRAIAIRMTSEPRVIAETTVSP